MTSDVDKAFAHSVKELGLDTMKSSLGAFYWDAVRSHDAIHDFILIAPSMYPRTPSSPSWHGKSAFLTYHWDTFDLAHSSYNEGMLGNYSAAFILLRATLELLIRGAFFECLAHKKFRDQAAILDKNKRGRNLKHFLNDLINRVPSIERDFEETSVSIYDKTSRILDDPNYRPSNIIMLRQLAKWRIFQGIQAPVTTVSHIYRKLSKDVHAHPNRTGIGRILIYQPSELFKPKKVLRRVLSEYLKDLRKVADIGIVITMNLLKENLEQFPQTRDQVRSPFQQRFRDQGLKHASARLSTLLTEHE
jgi:hypothetical protein